MMLFWFVVWSFFGFEIGCVVVLLIEMRYVEISEGNLGRNGENLWFWR